MDAVGTLSAGIAHDFNNILTAVFAYARQIDHHASGNAEAIAAAEGVRMAARQAAELTKALLAFSRGSPGVSTAVDLVELATETMDVLRHMLPAGVRLESRFPDEGGLWVRGDRTQLRRVLTNLAVNARDAMPDGGLLRLSLARVSTDTADGAPSETSSGREYAAIVVEDTGTGIAEAVRDRIFDPFFTTKTRERGTGMGLAIVHGIVTDHEGRIEVESSPGEGTRITVTLPCCDSGEAVSERYDVEVTPQPRPTVVLADDNQQVRSVVAGAFDAEGYEVLQFSTGTEAVDALRRDADRISLAIFDWDLPGMNGIACARAARDARADMPIILTSGPLDPREAEDPEGTALLRKPFEMPELIALAEQMLAKRNVKEGLSNVGG